MGTPPRGRSRRSLLVRGVRRLTAEPVRLYTHYWLRRRSSFVVSYPKSGRTWLAVMLGHLFSQITGRPLTIDVHTYADPSRGVPRIFFTHDGAGLTKTGPLTGDKRFYRGKRVLLLVRDPRDVVVSHYYQASRRKRHGPVVAELDAFIRGPLGIDRIITFMNGWAAHRSVPAQFATMRYEHLHEDCARELRRCVDFFGIAGVTDAALASAVEAGSFGQMRALESEGALDDPRLQPRDPADPDSYKVRRGLVGGYGRDLTDAQIRYLDEQIRGRLDPSFSYYRDRG